MTFAFEQIVSRTQTPVLGFASNEKSGVPRKSPTISAMRSWKCGRASTWLGPPPHPARCSPAETCPSSDRARWSFPCRDNVRRSAGPHGARAVSRRRNVDNAGSGEGSVEESFLGEFPATPTHGDFAATVCGDKIRRYRHRLEQIAETIGVRFNEKDSGIRGHGMRPLDVQRRFEFPSSTGIQTGLRAGGVHNLETAGGSPN